MNLLCVICKTVVLILAIIPFIIGFVIYFFYPFYNKWEKIGGKCPRCGIELENDELTDGWGEGSHNTWYCPRCGKSHYIGRYWHRQFWKDRKRQALEKRIKEYDKKYHFEEKIEKNIKKSSTI